MLGWLTRMPNPALRESDSDEFTRAEQAAEFIHSRTHACVRVSRSCSARGSAASPTNWRTPSAFHTRRFRRSRKAPRSDMPGNLVIGTVGRRHSRCHARTSASLRRILSAAGRISHSRFRPHGGEGCGVDQCRRRYQSQPTDAARWSSFVTTSICRVRTLSSVPTRNASARVFPT